jgi:hypothetical protein
MIVQVHRRAGEKFKGFSSWSKVMVSGAVWPFSFDMMASSAVEAFPRQRFRQEGSWKGEWRACWRRDNCSVRKPLIIHCCRRKGPCVCVIDRSLLKR